MTDTNKIIPHPRHYWGIMQGNNVVKTGTFNDCWSELVKTFGDKTLKELADMNIRIARVQNGGRS